MITLRDKIKTLAKFDEDLVTQKDDDYGSSWKKRGGVGAFMMLARKWDRIENFVRQHGYDVFAAIEAHPSLIEDMQDLGCYLWLVRSEGLVVEEVDVRAPLEEAIPLGADECKRGGPEPGIYDPRKKLDNPYAYAPDDDDPENDKPWSKIGTRQRLPNVGDTELRVIYKIPEKAWYILDKQARIALTIELRAHWNSTRAGYEPLQSLERIADAFGISLTPPDLPKIEVRSHQGRNSQFAEEESE